MNFEPLVFVVVAMAIITWVFWLIKKGLINPDNFIKDKPNKPNTNSKEIQVEIVK